MFRVFEGPSADNVWQQIAESFRAGEFVTGQESRAGLTSEILHAAISIENPRQRWVSSRRPALNIAFALAEVVWIVRGRNDAAFLNYFNRELPNFAGHGPTYHGAYGYRLRYNHGYDQLERACRALRANPQSRQVVLQIWHPKRDFPDEAGQAVAEDIPCNISSLLKVRGGRLEWLQVMRSNDLYRGLPYNFVQFTTLQEVLAGWLGLELGAYHQLSDSLHVYDNTAGDFGRSLPGLVAENRDNLAVTKMASDRAFGVLERLVEGLIAENGCLEDLIGSWMEASLPLAYQNIARVLCAESARRRQRRDLAKRLMEDCANPAFAQLYAAWLARVDSNVSAP